MPDSGGYRVIRNGERSNGGIFAEPRRARRRAWLPYFGIGGPRRAARRGSTGSAGGSFTGPVPVPAGRFAVLADPQGALFAVLTGDYDD